MSTTFQIGDPPDGYTGKVTFYEGGEYVLVFTPIDNHETVDHNKEHQ